MVLCILHLARWTPAKLFEELKSGQDVAASAVATVTDRILLPIKKLPVGVAMLVLVGSLAVPHALKARFVHGDRSRAVIPEVRTDVLENVGVTGRILFAAVVEAHHGIFRVI